MDWNPSAPDKIGLQWASRNRQGQQPFKSIAALTDGALMRMAMSTSETVTSINTPMRQAPTPGATTQHDVLISGAEVAVDFTTTTVRPNASSQSGSTWTTAGGSTSNVYQSFDEAVLDTSDYAKNNLKTNGGAGGYTPILRIEFGTAGLFTGQRIVAVRVHAIGQEIPGLGGYAAGPFVQRLEDDAQTQRAGIFPQATYGLHVFDMAEFMLLTGALDFWTVADVQAMDTTSLQVGLQAFYPWGAEAYNSEYRIYQVWLEVDHCDENRLARGVSASVLGDAGPEYRAPVMAEPDGTAWTKDGTDAALLLRTPRWGNGFLGGFATAGNVMLLQGFGDVPSSTGLSYYPDVVLDPGGTVASLGDPVFDTVFAAHLVAGATPTPDSQDYGGVYEVAVNAASQPVQQEVSGASAQDYHGVRFPVIMDETLGLAGTLTVRLRRRSDNVVMGTATVTADDYVAALIEPILREWRMVQTLFAVPATLAGATQYYLDFTADGVGSWIVQALSAEVHPGAVPDDVAGTFGSGTYGGTADCATFAGVETVLSDISALVYVQPPVPADVAAAPGEQTVEYVDDECNVADTACAPGIGVNVLTWTESTLGVDLGFYEIQRMDPYTEWASIAEITDVAVELFTDYEARRGIESTYRIRVVDTDGFESNWSAEVASTAPVLGVGYTFTSNEDPTYNLAYADVVEGSTNVVRDYRFPEADEMVDQAMAGRDYDVGFQPAERRGAHLSMLVLVGNIAAATPGPRGFDPLRALAKAHLSYVCVRDESGERFFATLQIPNGRVRMVSATHLAQVTVKERTDLPSTPDAIIS